MRFLSVKQFIILHNILERVGYKPTLSSSNIAQIFKQLNKYISQYSVDIQLWNNVLVINFYNSNKVIEVTFTYEKEI